MHMTNLRESMAVKEMERTNANPSVPSAAPHAQTRRLPIFMYIQIHVFIHISIYNLSPRPSS